MESNQLITIIKENGLNQENKINDLMAGFAGQFKVAKEIASGSGDIVVTDESQVELMEDARNKRLELRRVRINVENTRKELKAESIREGKAIDGIANIIKALIVPAEKHLEKQEKYAEVKEKERLEKSYSERVERLSKYVGDVSFYNLKEMSDDVFEKLLEGCKKGYEAQVRAEKQIEIERIAKEKADREEQERIREENEKLKIEAKKREEEEAIRTKKLNEKLRAERKAKREIEAKANKERADREREEREARQKIEAERRAKEEAERQALLAPDKEKLIDLAGQIGKMELPNVKSKAAGNVINEAEKMLISIVDYLLQESKVL